MERFGFYLGAIVLAVVVWVIDSYMRSGGSIYQAAPIQEKAVDAFLEMNRLITTLGTTLLGAMGFLLFGGRNAVRNRMSRFPQARRNQSIARYERVLCKRKARSAKSAASVRILRLDLGARITTVILLFAERAELMDVVEGSGR